MAKHYFEIFRDEYGYTVKKFTPNGYPRSSVLAGQTLIQFQDTFDTLEEAQKAYPSATNGHVLISERNTFDHLPGEEL